MKIYTTIDSRIQQHAEKAVETHLAFELQNAFTKNNATRDNPPFSDDITKAQIDTIVNRVRQSMTYKKLVEKAGYCERPSRYMSATTEGYKCSYCGTVTPKQKKRLKIVGQKEKARVFDWKSTATREKDTLFSTYYSVRYQGLLRAGMMSINPHNGHIKSWVGGPNFKHFKYDMVKKEPGKRLNI